MTIKKLKMMIKSNQPLTELYAKELDLAVYTDECPAKTQRKVGAKALEKALELLGLGWRNDDDE